MLLSKMCLSCRLQDTQEQLDIIEQLRQELRLAKIRIQHMEER